MNDKVWGVLGHVLLAAFLGVVGQFFRGRGRPQEGVRHVYEHPTFPIEVYSQKLLTSLGITIAMGAIVGVLAGIQNATGTPDTKILLGFIGAGYLGTDFIEGFMKKALPIS